MNVTETIRKLERKFDKSAEKIMLRHPLLFYAAVFLATPLLVLLCVCLCTLVIIYPLSWIFGWL